MKVSLINYTHDAKDILVFSKRTRHMSGLDAFDEVRRMSPEQRTKELDYVFKSIGSALEFVDYTFLIAEVTRGFTHQFVRHRVGTSFAQQSQRLADMGSFTYSAFGKAKESELYHDTMQNISHNYAKMVHVDEVNIQDARGVLPTNIHTNILFKANLRTINGMMNMRLCVRAQGEFQDVMMAMRRQILAMHPFAEPALNVYCVEKGLCMWPNFHECPIKKKYPHLQPDFHMNEAVKEDWLKVVGHSPQPVVQDSDE